MCQSFEAYLIIPFLSAVIFSKKWLYLAFSAIYVYSKSKNMHFSNILGMSNGLKK